MRFPKTNNSFYYTIGDVAYEVPTNIALGCGFYLLFIHLHYWWNKRYWDKQYEKAKERYVQYLIVFSDNDR